MRPLPTLATPQALCPKKGYDFDEVRGIVAEIGFTAHVRARGPDVQAIKQKSGFNARCCLVELLIVGSIVFVAFLFAWRNLPTFLAPYCIRLGIITWRATAYGNRFSYVVQQNDTTV